MARAKTASERLFYEMAELAREHGFNLDEARLTAIPLQGVNCSVEIVLRRYGAEVDVRSL